MMTPLFFCIVYIQFVDKIQVLFVIPVGLRECLPYFWVDLGRLWMRKNRTLVNGTKQDLEETNGSDNFGMVVVVLVVRLDCTFNFINPSSNPAEINNFSCEEVALKERINLGEGIAISLQWAIPGL